MQYLTQKIKMKKTKIADKATIFISETLPAAVRYAMQKKIDKTLNISDYKAVLHIITNKHKQIYEIIINIQFFYRK